MGIFTFEHCCFCVDLRIGSLIIGYIILMGNIALTVLAVYGLEGGVLLKSLNLVGAYELGVAMLVSNAILIIIIAVYIVFTVLLLVGIHKNKSKFVKFYLIYAGVFVVTYAIIFFVGLGNGRTGAGDIIQGIVTIILNVYFFLVVKSFYDTMQVEDIQISYRP